MQVLKNMYATCTQTGNSSTLIYQKCILVYLPNTSHVRMYNYEIKQSVMKDDVTNFSGKRMMNFHIQKICCPHILNELQRHVFVAVALIIKHWNFKATNVLELYSGLLFNILNTARPLNKFCTAAGWVYSHSNYVHVNNLVIAICKRLHTDMCIHNRDKYSQ